MKHVRTVVSSACFAILSPVVASAAEPVFVDRFERAEKDDTKEQPGRGWKTNSKGRAKGDKQADLVDGVLVITTSPRADHAAVVHRAIDLDDARITCRFRLGPTDRLTIAISDPGLKETVHAGHVCCVRVEPKFLVVDDQMNGRFEMSRHRRATAGENIKGELKPFTRRAKHDLEPDVWHELEIVIAGSTITATVDGDASVSHTSPGFDHPTKKKFAFSVPKRAEVDNLRIWADADRGV